jgi:hypothetical protein
MFAGEGLKPELIIYPTIILHTLFDMFVLRLVEQQINLVLRTNSKK